MYTKRFDHKNKINYKYAKKSGSVEGGWPFDIFVSFTFIICGRFSNVGFFFFWQKKHTTLWLDIYLYNSCINNWVWWISAVRICVLCHFFAARATIFGRSIWTSLYVNFEENRLIDIANWSKSKIDRTHPVILSSGYDKSIWRFIFHVNSFFLCHSFPF